MQDLSYPSGGLTLNWTVASSGGVSNAIPEDARALGDVRADDVADFAGLEASIREKISKAPHSRYIGRCSLRTYLSPDVASPAVFTHRRIRTAQRINDEYGGKLSVATKSPGAGADAAFAALKTDAPILEGMRLRMYRAQSNEDEYIVISSIEPRLYMSTRLIIDFSLGRTAAK